jgi:16S rRNA (guanine527-N7)-methyltransferase
MSPDPHPVSRGTPPAPDTARGVFGSRWTVAAAYADLLVSAGVTRGLIGPREAPRIWDRHLLNCAVLAEVIPEGVDVCDVGSGAGLPGLVLAIARPDLTVTLLEPLLRRTTFLTETVQQLDLTNTEVLRGRAEEVHGKRDFAIVTSRAVASLPRLLDWSMPLVRQGGALVAMKGASVADEVASASVELRRWHAGAVEILELGRGVIDPPCTVVRVPSDGPSRLGWEAAEWNRQPAPSRRADRKGRT